MKKIRWWIKGVVFDSALLRRIFILVYKLGGARPWSAGYSVYKFDYIARVLKGDLGLWRKRQLPLGYGAGLDERAVEYPWFFSSVKATERDILDAGSALNHADLLRLDFWKGRGLRILTLAPEGRARGGIVPRYIYEDVRRMSFEKETFDAVVSISTLEHVGMDNTVIYTGDQSKNENDPSAYLRAVQEIKRVLKPGGSFYLTLPYGQYRNLGWMQVFDEKMLRMLIQEFSPAQIQETYFKYDRRQWNFSTSQECAGGGYGDARARSRDDKINFAAAQCVACLRLSK